jgi:cellulose synthase/poly-beta-1,6-N-acetylglucosamine synthase-like glycosyltransferase
MKAAAGLFWLSVAWLAYVWVGYPLALAVAALFYRFRPKTADGYHPTVSVLIAAHNEEKDIGWKLAQTLAWDYPTDRLEVLVGRTPR